jgi:steroid 5-alpha reductase family enzyme
MTDLFIRIALFEVGAKSPQLQHLAGSFVIVMIAAAMICFVVSEITFNYSQVDKLWSLMPIVYCLMALAAFPSPRLWIMFFLVAVWGFRLSYNFHRKGGYNIIPWKGVEDYRWKIMRNTPVLKGRFRFGLFNLFFISFYQHFLILLFCTPLLMAAKNRDTSLNWLDIIAASLMLFFIITETIADNQLFKFHKLKKQGGSPEGPYAGSLKKGFISEGLWRYVRHPNYASEQAIWISFYLFGVATSGKWINYTIAGSVLLVILFLGSSSLTEKISSEKYADYAAYKKEVPGFFPRLFSYRINF